MTADGIELCNLMRFNESLVTFEFPIWADTFDIYPFVANRYIDQNGFDENTEAISDVLQNHVEYLRTGYEHSSKELERLQLPHAPVLRHTFSSPIALGEGACYKILHSVYRMKFSDGTALFSQIPALCFESDKERTRWEQVWLIHPDIMKEKPKRLIGSHHGNFSLKENPIGH